MDYWKECVAEAFEDAGIEATDDQIDTVSSWVECAHDNYSMAHGHDFIPNPLSSENERLKRELETERNKIHCKECGGQGQITIIGPYHSSTSDCWKCRGEGRVLP